MINNIIKKLVSSYENTTECSFEDDELYTIYKMKFHIVDNENIEKLIYLICNVKSNLNSNFIKFLKKITSLKNQFFIDSELNNENYFLLPIESIRDNLEKIDNILLNINQTFVFNQLKEDKNYFIKSGTSSGKTFISSHILVEKYKYFKKIEDIEKNDFYVVMIVPTEMLESQIISSLCNSKSIDEDIKIQIGNNPLIHKILILTQEKLFAHKEICSMIKYLIVDECHKLLEENKSNRDDFLEYIIEYSIKPNIENGRLNFLLLSPFYENDYILKIKKIFGTKKVFLLSLKGINKSVNKIIKFDFPRKIKNNILINNQISSFLFKNKYEIKDVSEV